MNKLQNRLLDYNTRVYAIIKSFDKDPLLFDNKNQLLRSSSSPGANYSEAQSASSRKDFHNKIRIALKEMRESFYWLNFFQRINKPNDQLDSLIEESEELCKILSAIAFKTQKP